MQTVLYLCAFLKLLQHSLNLHAGMKFFLLYFTRKKSSIRFRGIKLSLFLNRDAASVIFILATLLFSVQNVLLSSFPDSAHALNLPRSSISVPERFLLHSCSPGVLSLRCRQIPYIQDTGKVLWKYQHLSLIHI